MPRRAPVLLPVLDPRTACRNLRGNSAGQQPATVRTSRQTRPVMRSVGGPYPDASWVGAIVSSRELRHSARSTPGVDHAGITSDRHVRFRTRTFSSSHLASVLAPLSPPKRMGPRNVPTECPDHVVHRVCGARL